MISIANSNNKVISTIAAILLGVASIMGLQGCSSSSDSVTVVPTQDASGLFNGLGTLNTQSLDDLKGIVHANRVMLFSVTANLVIDGTLSVTNDDFTGTVKIYKNGVIADQAASVSGKVTTASSITGTITNSTVANGTFELTFDPLYNRGASVSRIDTSAFQFDGDIYTSIPDMVTGRALDFISATSYELTLFKPLPNTQCSIAGSVSIPDSSVNIYLFDEVLTQDNAECTVSDTPNYTGFASVVDGVFTDDTLLYVVTNGRNSIFGILIKT